jgi:phage-related protein
MAQTIAQMMVEIGADPSEFQNTSKVVEKEMKSMGTTVSGMAKSMGTDVKGFSDKWRAMSDEMKESYKASKAALMPFKKDLMGVEYDFFKLSKSMKDYQGTNKEFMGEVTQLGKRHKQITDEMMKNNDLMKSSFIQSVGQMVARSGQSEKIAANFSKMNNPLYTVNNKLLKMGTKLEDVAKNGTASVLALKKLGPTANMKELLDMTMLINRGLMRSAFLALGMAVPFVIALGAVVDLAYAINEDLGTATENMKGVWAQVFEPLAQLVGAILFKVIEFITWIGELMNKFNDMNPVLATAIQAFGLLFLGLMVILSPLAIGIGMFGGLQAAFAAVWMIIGPFVTGFLAVAGTAVIVAAAIVAVGAALYLLWTKTDWFKSAVMKVWDAIKSGTKAAWDWVMNNVIKPVLTAIQNFIKDKMDYIKKFWNENGEMIKQAAQNVWKFISTYIGAQLAAILAIMKVVWPVIKEIVSLAWNAIKNIVSGAIDIILGIIKFFSALFTGNWKGMWEAVKQIISGAVQIITGIQKAFVDKILSYINQYGDKAKAIYKNIWETAKTLFSAGIEAIKGKVSDGFNAILSFITGLGSTFFEAGKGLIEMMAKGITSAAKKVTSAVSSLAQKARDFLPFSPAKEGPLSDLDKLDFGGPISDSLDKAIPKVKGLMGDLMTMPSIKANGGDGGSSVTNHESIGTINVVIPAEDIKEFKDVTDFFKRLPQQARKHGEKLPNYMQINMGRG